MPRFRFRLGKVLGWRATQLELAQAGYQREREALAELDRSLAAWEAAGIRAELQVRGAGEVTGSELTALAGFRVFVRAKGAELLQRKAAQWKKLAAAEAALMEARRRCRLLERLQERQRAEWLAGEDAELEAAASDSFLAGWNRRKARERRASL
jgi:flagellar export protein FliJ